jgi:DNA-binding MarR family transcriptional regulator
VDAVADRLHSAALHLLRRLRAEDDLLGISPPRLSALSVVVFGGPLTIGALAQAEGVKPPTMTRLVDGLERDGLVTREPDPADRRAVRVRATKDGRRVLIEGRGRRVAALAAGLRRLPDRDLATLRRAAELLERVARPKVRHP